MSRGSFPVANCDIVDLLPRSTSFQPHCPIVLHHPAHFPSFRLSFRAPATPLVSSTLAD
ncbi:hypothetical protein EI94DRAFT_1761297 [Lactarius quietus]|nr:hypothetical protein EI94DRAFT_1761297 [Lactarius quietus]